MVGRCEDGGRNGADRLFLAAVLRLAAQAHWMRVVLSRFPPLRIRVERRFPALSSLRGHIFAQDSKCPSVGKRLISIPISETIASALSEFTPGMVLTSSTAIRKGSRLASTSRKADGQPTMPRDSSITQADVIGVSRSHLS